MTLTVATTATPAGLTGLGAVQPHVKAAAELIAAQGGITKVGGWRAFSDYDPLGHPAGLAVDFPGTVAQGNAMARYATANADALAVRYVIWQQRIWSPGKSWTAMADRGSASANHMDHVHVSFKATGAAPSMIDNLRKGIGSVPVVGDLFTKAGDAVGNAFDTASNATTILNPAAWGNHAQKVGLKLAVVGAGLGLVLLGSWRLVLPAATTATSKAMEAIA